MFNNSSHVDASHSVFSEVHQDQYYTASSTIQGNQTINTVVHGNQVIQDSHSSEQQKYQPLLFDVPTLFLDAVEALYKASAPSAAYDSAQRYPAPKCIEGTRIEVLARITSWMDEPDQKPVCWLNGRPGSGKSAVSQTIAEKYADEKRLAASFFFSRRDLERRTIQHVVPTLTTQLLVFLPSIRASVVTALEKGYMIPQKVLREQIEKLLFGPLSTATETLESPPLIIVDALDECDDQGLVLEFVTLLALLPSRSAVPLRILITSRAEPWIQSRFHKSDIAALTQPLDIHSFSADADIRSFLYYALDDVCDQHPQVMQDVSRPWPPSADLERVVNKSGGLFIFALTVVKFVGDKTHNPILRLQAILEDTASESAGSAYADLDSLYRDAIATFPDPDTARLVLGLVYCMTIPMSVPGFHKLLQRSDVDVRLVVPSLSSVLLASEDGKQPIQFYHASFRDFLINHQRSRKYTIDPNTYHRLMAQLCFDTMSNLLKRDMCGIGDPAKANSEVLDLTERRKEAFDEALLYACRYWSHHLEQLPNDGFANEGLLRSLKRFSTTVLLCWIESLSLFGELESAVVMLRQCIRWLKTLPQISQGQLPVIKEAEGLVVLCMDSISECALHVYLTGILITPNDSIICKTFSHQSFGTLIRYPERIDFGTAMRRGLDLHNNVHCITFSPNDNLIATAGENLGVQVWNTITGGNVASLGDHSSTSLIVRFSPSGAFLAAAFEGGTVAVWDPKVGREHMKQEACHSEQITCIEFSANSALLASGSRDRAIQVWSVETAQPLHRLATHEGPLKSLIFSSDSLRLISGAEDNLIITWDTTTGKVVHGMMGHRKSVNCLTISKDGKMVASGSEDKTIKIWDLNSGKCTKTFSKGHHTGIRSVHFFDEDKYVVTACDEMILLWNVTSRNSPDKIWDLEHLFRKALKFAPAWQTKMMGWGVPRPALRYLIHKTEEESGNANQLAVAYATQSPSFIFTRQSALIAGSLPNPVIGLARHSAGKVTAAGISSDGNWAVAADNFGSFYILDLTVSERTWADLDMDLKAYPFHLASQMIPSPDGARFVIDSALQWYLTDENTRIIKKIDTGLLGSMREDDDIRFKFSPDGRIILCVISSLFDDDKSSLRILDSMTGELRVKFSGLKKVHSFLASVDGAWVACGYGSGQVGIIRMESKERTSIGEPDNSPIKVLLFSTGAKELVGGSQSGVVRVWDRASGECKATFETSTTSAVTALAYTITPSNTSRVAIGREDGSLSLWSPSTSASHDVVNKDQAKATNVDFIRFSDDLTKLTSRGGDGVMFDWTISLDEDMDQCALCSESLPNREDGDGDSKGTNLPHLVRQSDAEEAVDSLFHTDYRVRKDGWLVKGDRRVIWIPPLMRPRGRNTFFAYENGQVVLFTPNSSLVFLKWVDR